MIFSAIPPDIHIPTNREYWTSKLFSGERTNWEGHAFERVVEDHVEQIKDTLRVGGVESRQSSWRSLMAKPAVQIDLIIDRADGAISLTGCAKGDGKPLSRKPFHHCKHISSYSAV